MPTPLGTKFTRCIFTMKYPLSNGNHYLKFSNYQANVSENIEGTMFIIKPVSNGTRNA